MSESELEEKFAKVEITELKKIIMLTLGVMFGAVLVYLSVYFLTGSVKIATITAIATTTTIATAIVIATIAVAIATTAATTATTITTATIVIATATAIAATAAITNTTIAIATTTATVIAIIGITAIVIVATVVFKNKVGYWKVVAVFVVEGLALIFCFKCFTPHGAIALLCIIAVVRLMFAGACCLKKLLIKYPPPPPKDVSSYRVHKRVFPPESWRELVHRWLYKKLVV